MEKPKILLACPTYDGKKYCLDYWAEKVKELQTVIPCDVLLVDNSKNRDYSRRIESYGFKVLKSKHYKKTIKSIGEAKKKLNNYLIKNNYDFHFSLEQDLFPDKDVLKKLLNNFKKMKRKEVIIGAPYYYRVIRFPEKNPSRSYTSCVAKGVVYSRKYNREIQDPMLSEELEKKKGMIKVFAVGFGCCLIPTPVVKKINVKYSENNFKPDDAFFYQDCKRLGIPVYADVDLIKKVKHIPGSNAPESNGLFSWTS